MQASSKYPIFGLHEDSWQRLLPEPSEVVLMADHPALVDMWKRLSQGKNVLVFVDYASPEIVGTKVSAWFKTLIKTRINSVEYILQNGTFLIFRQITMGVSEGAKGSYDLMVLTERTVEEILICLTPTGQPESPSTEPKNQ